MAWCPVCAATFRRIRRDLQSTFAIVQPENDVVPRAVPGDL